MRLFTYVLLISLVGCGSKSETAPTAAGVPLSIKNPEAETQKQAVEKDVSLKNPAVDQLIAAAKNAVVSGQPSGAIEALSQAIGISSKEARLFRLRADVYVLMRQYANAKADFTLALNLEPNNPELLNVRGYFLMTRGLADEAMADLTKAVEVDPSMFTAWNNRGLVSLSKKNYSAAEADFQKAADANNKYADALNNLGFSKYKLKKYDEALVNLQAAIKQNPKYTTAWNNCGLVYMAQENFTEAIKAFDQTVALAPTDARWLNHRRAALLKLNRFEEAAADAQKIRWLAGLQQLTTNAVGNARSADAWITRGQYLVQGSQYGAAVQDFSRALALAPASTDALTGRAKAWLNTGEARKAISDCDESLVTNPTTEAYSVRGDAWFRLKNYDQAVRDFESAKRFDETVAAAYKNRAQQLRNDGKNELAKSDEAKAKQILAGLAGQLGGDETQPIPFPEQ